MSSLFRLKLRIPFQLDSLDFTPPPPPPPPPPNYHSAIIGEQAHNNGRNNGRNGNGHREVGVATSSLAFRENGFSNARKLRKVSASNVTLPHPHAHHVGGKRNHAPFHQELLPRLPNSSSMPSNLSGSICMDTREYLRPVVGGVAGAVGVGGRGVGVGKTQVVQVVQQEQAHDKLECWRQFIYCLLANEVRLDQFLTEGSRCELEITSCVF